MKKQTVVRGVTGQFSRKILMTSALSAAGALMLAASPALAIDDYQTPQGENVVGGSASFSRPSEGLLNIDQHSDRVVIDWNSFNIGSKAKTEFFQPGSGSLAVNRVTGNGDPTQILGTLKANGQVMVLDRNGVIFGKDSVVDVGGIIASTGDVDTAAVMNGDKVLQLSNSGSGKIELNGVVSVADSGLAAFVAPTVVNNGLIQAKLGKVAFASGEKVTLDLYGDNLVEIAVSDKAADALIENNGVVNAEGGTVIMTAQAAKSAVDNVINMNGVVKVSSVEVQGGKIVLKGGEQGTVKVSGTLDASGKTGGGSVEISGENAVVEKGAAIHADAYEEGNGGHVEIWGDRNALLFGNVSAEGGALSGNGGFVELSSAGQVGFDGYVDTFAPAGETGTFLIDPQNILLGDYAIGVTTASLLADQGLGGASPLVLIDKDAVARILTATNIDLWATNSISTDGVFDISTSDGLLYSPAGTISSYDLTLSAPTINITDNIILGTGKLIIADRAAGTGGYDIWPGVPVLNAPGNIYVNTVNLNGQILTRTTTGGATSVAGDSQINSQAKIVNVLSPGALIQQGIYLANDAGGATVNVGAGTYAEDVVVNKALTLNGAAGHTSVITPSSPGVHVTADNVTVDGLAIDGATTAGVWVDGADNVTVKNNLITNSADAGVLVEDSENAKVRDNTITTAAEGVVGDSAANLWVYNNDITGTTLNGVHVSNSGGTTYGGGAGSDVDIWRNRISGAAGSTGILVENSDYVTVGPYLNNQFGPDGLATGNVVTGGATGIKIVDSAHAAVFYNTLSGQSGNGIVIDPSPSSLVEYNDITGGVNGIVIADSDNATVYSNTLSGQTYNGILAYGSNGALIDSNTVTASALGNVSGIRIEGGTGHDVRFNTVNSGYWGILMAWTGSDSTVENNWVGQTTGTLSNGIYIYDNGGSTDVENNHVYNAGWDGINVSGGGTGFVTVAHNDVHNTVGASGIAVVGHYGDGLVDQNTIEDSARLGIYVGATNGLTVSGNTVTNSGTANIAGPFGMFTDGIYLEQASNTTVSGNTVNDTTGNGIRVGGGGNWAAAATTGNVIEGNFVGTLGGAGNIEGDGIHIEDSAGVQILTNEVANTAFDGIYLDPSPNALIEGNILNDIGDIAIEVLDSANVKVQSNRIDTAVEGVAADNALSLWVYDNDITNTALNGVHVSNSDGTDYVNDIDIWKNRINGAASSTGILVENSDFASIGPYKNLQFGPDDLSMGNVITGVETGIKVTDSAEAKIVHNDVTASCEGVVADNTANLWVYDNTVSGTRLNGIHVSNSDGTIYGGGADSDVDIWNNRVTPTAGTGILVEDSDYATVGPYLNNQFGPDGLATGNIVTGGNTGIKITGSDHAAVFYNTVSGQTGDGVDVIDSDYALIGGNYVHNVGGDGIFVDPSDYVEIYNNWVELAAFDGIHIQDGQGHSVHNNWSYDNGDDGIDIENAFGFNVLNNDADGNGDAGINVGGNSIFFNVIGNTLDGNDVGIRVSDSLEGNIDQNIIDNSITTGIELGDVQDIGLLENVIGNSGQYGLWARGGDNGFVVLTGNIFNDNPVGARFESGIIDVRGDANHFNGGDVGMQFDLFDQSHPESLKIFKNTLGTTVFNGQSTFYVQLMNHALWHPGTPTVIDALNVNFNGFVPAKSPFGPGILTQAQFDALEAKIFHYLDGEDLGLIFFGIVPSVDQSDIFRGVDPFAALAASVSVTITGLPRVPGNEGFSLNALSPAAGGDMTPEELAALTPAAGPGTSGGTPGQAGTIQNSNCWGDAMGYAATGQVSNFSFGGTFGDEGLAGANCTSGF